MPPPTLTIGRYLRKGRPVGQDVKLESPSREPLRTLPRARVQSDRWRRAQVQSIGSQVHTREKRAPHMQMARSRLACIFLAPRGGIGCPRSSAIRPLSYGVAVFRLTNRGYRGNKRRRADSVGSVRREGPLTFIRLELEPVPLTAVRQFDLELERGNEPPWNHPEPCWQACCTQSPAFLSTF